MSDQLTSLVVKTSDHDYPTRFYSPTADTVVIQQDNGEDSSCDCVLLDKSALHALYMLLANLFEEFDG